jgi:hypothetical protein
MVDIHFIVLLKLPRFIRFGGLFFWLVHSLWDSKDSLLPRGEFSAKLSPSGRDGSWIFGGVKIKRVKVKLFPNLFPLK